MSRAYSDLAFTERVRAMQSRMGSRQAYAPLDLTDDRRDSLTAREAEFISARDGFYQATVGETGWPYVQFRGGPAGFLKVLDAKTLAYADVSGNRQYISVGNLQGNDRVSLFFMDYAAQRRLKLLGRVRFVEDDPELLARLRMPGVAQPAERAVLITVEAYDWNCPKHITPRFTEAEINEAVRPLRTELERLRAQASQAELELGSGPLRLRISGVRELTPRVRAYELRDPEGRELPAVRAGAHIDVPVRLASGALSTRRYSISSNPARRDAYEIAVLREDGGSGGSVAVHQGYRLGMTLHCGMPGNDFNLHEDERPAVLIAAGVGITPIKAMALRLRALRRPVELHYAVRSRREGAYLDRLEREFGAGLHVYAKDAGQRLDLAAVLAAAPADALFYLCGPRGLLEDAQAAAAAQDLDPKRLRVERFRAAQTVGAEKALTVTLARSGRQVAVNPLQTVLEALEDAGVAVPFGCRGGSCGDCAVKVLGGTPEHRDTVLSANERRERMCVCVSRAQGPELTLDL
ncbi:2Fe-2S iron-sulfur cluster-binding protein [Inhella sp.]|uniref:2Fe-2S iron-sulfur cluster-binding protein n=1 Tax=Inhella sp. TaxID=1921806 RepID=UPI0035B26525